MSDLEGRWARLPNGRLVRIVGVDGDVVVAETIGGVTVDRPLAHVRARWTVLADDSLTVLAATNPDALKARLEVNPVDVVVDAIRELGGEADTARIQKLLQQTIGTWVGTRAAAMVACPLSTSKVDSGRSSTPSPVLALPCGSRSMMSTRSPTAASAVPRLMAVVVLPTPPF